MLAPGAQIVYVFPKHVQVFRDGEGVGEDTPVLKVDYHVGPLDEIQLEGDVLKPLIPVTKWSVAR